MSRTGSGAKVRSKKMPESKVALLLRLQQGLKDRLADLAKREHRSLNQQIEFLLEQALSGEVKRPQNDQQRDRSVTGKS
jgi:hypothetical protein